MANEGFRLPSGMGGLTRFNESTNSVFTLHPGHVIILAVLVIIIEILLHLYGRGLLGF